LIEVAHELGIGERFAKGDTLMPSEGSQRLGLSHRVQMQWEHDLEVFVQLEEITDRSEDGMEGAGNVLSPVQGDEYLAPKRTAFHPSEFVDDPTEHVHDGVPSDVDLISTNTLAKQGVSGSLGRRKVSGGNPGDQTPMHFFWKGTVCIICPQSSLHVCDRDPLIKGGERAGESCAGVPMYEHKGGSLLAENRFQVLQMDALRVARDCPLRITLKCTSGCRPTAATV
jgi:hypothetical protein